MLQMTNRSKRLSERSSRSTDNRRSDKDLEHFWHVVLSSEKRTVTWVIDENVDDDDDDGEVEHTLFLKLAVLGINCVNGEQNIVVLQSPGYDGKPQKGAIANLRRDLNPMAQLGLTIAGKNGCTLTLSEGSGPVTIAGNHMVGYPSEDEMDETQMDEEEDIENELHETDDESEEEIKDKSAKRKATPKAIKHKQKAKMDVEDDQSGEGEEDDDDDDEDEDYDFEKEVKNKKFKKAKVVGKKSEKAAKTKPEKDSGKKTGKNVKK